MGHRALPLAIDGGTPPFRATLRDAAGRELAAAAGATAGRFSLPAAALLPGPHRIEVSDAGDRHAAVAFDVLPGSRVPRTLEAAAGGRRARG